MRQRDFILSCLKTVHPKCQIFRIGTEKKKLSSRKYYFTKNDLQFKVCKMLFLKTLQISHGPVDRALREVNEIGSFNLSDKRGLIPQLRELLTK